jgi:hypothetical protein
MVITRVLRNEIYKDLCKAGVSCAKKHANVIVTQRDYSNDYMLHILCSPNKAIIRISLRASNNKTQKLGINFVELHSYKIPYADPECIEKVVSLVADRTLYYELLENQSSIFPGIYIDKIVNDFLKSKGV